MLRSAKVELESIDAVSGRGVGVHSCTGGTYLINDLAYEHALHDVEGINHPATLGIVLAAKIAGKLNVPAYFVNPMSTDELSDVARMTGIRGLYRPSHAHPLNMKQVAIHHSELMGKRYEDCNYVIMHMAAAPASRPMRRAGPWTAPALATGKAPSVLIEAAICASTT